MGISKTVSTQSSSQTQHVETETDRDSENNIRTLPPQTYPLAMISRKQCWRSRPSRLLRAVQMRFDRCLIRIWDALELPVAKTNSHMVRTLTWDEDMFACGQRNDTLHWSRQQHKKKILASLHLEKYMSKHEHGSKTASLWRFTVIFNRVCVCVCVCVCSSEKDER